MFLYSLVFSPLIVKAIENTTGNSSDNVDKIRYPCKIVPLEQTAILNQGKWAG